MGCTSTFGITILCWIIERFCVSISSSDTIIFSMIFPPIGVLDIGLRYLSALGGFSFGIGTISEILLASGHIPVLIAQLVMMEKVMQG